MLVRHTSAFPQNKRAGGLGARGSWPTPMPGERKRERDGPEWPEPQHRRTNSAGNRGVRRLAFEAGWGLVLPGSGFESR